jgi:NAD-dependent dihydropyrimidine dehydrogenase PreA subunit
MSQKIAVVVSKSRQPSIEQERVHSALVAGLEHRPDLDVIVVPHLYDLAPDGPAVQSLRSIQGDLVMLAWLYPRSAFWVLDANAVRGRLKTTVPFSGEDAPEPARKSGRSEISDRTIWCFDLRTHDDPKHYLSAIEQILAGRPEPAKEAGQVAGPANGRARVVDTPTRPRWYPVIDLDRCTDCKECLNFCLFGVYGLDRQGAIFVEQPDACRPGCPACARICPAGAILFPQHNDPAIAGDPQAPLQGLKLDLSQIFSGIDPAALAAEERRQALANAETRGEAPAAEGDKPPAKKPSLDQLVDKVDELDL